jgi:cellulose synthase operon protein C
MPRKLSAGLLAGAVVVAAGLAASQFLSGTERNWLLGSDTLAQSADAPRDAGADGDPDAATGPSSIQADEPSTAQGNPETAEPAEQPAAVDESALRFFARQGDRRRLEAEIARLRALYPGWTPPENPLAVPANSDARLDQMWELYAQGRFAEARKAIAERQAAEPGWLPPEDLLQRLNVAESREQLINASNLKQYETVIRLGSSTPSLLTCSDIDVLWRVAEAFAQTARKVRARDAYQYILDSCQDSAERFATVQKAMQLLSRTDVETLLVSERKGSDGVGEFAGIRQELARQSLAAANADPKMVVQPADLAAVERLAEGEGLASDALLLGWYHLRRDNFAEAERWFRRAREKEDGAEASQGLGLALLALSRPAEGESMLRPWWERSNELRSSYLAAAANLLAIDPPVDIGPEVLQRIVAATVAGKDAATGQQIGWYAMALNQFETASHWFEQALAWKPDDEPSAFGLILARRRLGDTDGVTALQRAWAGHSERIATLGVAPSTRAPAAATEPPVGPKPTGRPPQERNVVADRSASNREPSISGRQHAATRPNCSVSVRPETLSPAQALSRGWCLMDLNRPLEAAPAFEVALRSSSQSIRRDAAYGQSLAYLRAGLADKAAVSANKAPQTKERRLELQTALLADRALGAFEAGRYVESLLALDQLEAIAPRRLDLLVLRGYAYMNLRRFGEARKVFRAVAATGSKDGAKGLADLEAAASTRGD